MIISTGIILLIYPIIIIIITFFSLKANLFDKRTFRMVFLIVPIALICVLLSVQLEYLGYGQLVILSNYIDSKVAISLYVSLIEEVLKSLCVLILFYKYGKKDFNAILLYAVGIGFGFSFIETILYRFYLQYGAEIIQWELVWRATITNGMHIVSQVAFATCYFAISQRRKISGIISVPLCILLAVFIHSGYNLLVSTPSFKWYGFVFVLIVSSVLVVRIRQIH